jgi:HSP20 family protein
MTYSWVSKELNDFSREFYEFTMPAMDIFENEDGNELIVKIDLPGFAKKDIKLGIDDDVLRIRAKRELENELRYGSIYYKHRPRQIDKKNYTNSIFPRQRKNRWNGNLC